MAGIKAAQVQLPSQRNVPVTNLLEYLILFYGREKIGKTSLAAQFPDSIFLMCEPGGKALNIFKLDVKDWYEFKGAVAEVLKDKRFKTVIVDTVDKAYDYCQDAVCKNLAIDHPSDEEWGKGWGKVREEFSGEFTRLAHSGKGLVLISHAKETEIKRRGGNNTTRISPTMAAGARQVLEPMVDIWAYMAYEDEGRREMWLRGDDVVAAGHRLQDRFVGVSKVPMGKSAAEAYRNLVAAWNGTSLKGGTESGGTPRLKLRGK